MPLDTWFQVFSGAALLGWLLLLFAPSFVLTRLVVRSGALPLALSAAYLICIAPSLAPRLLPGLLQSFRSLSGVMQLFGDPRIVLAGWVHYLAFDLWIGAWIVSDSRERAIPHWQVALVLPFTFMLGPVGLLLYFLVLRRKPLAVPAAAARASP